MSFSRQRRTMLKSLAASALLPVSMHPLQRLIAGTAAAMGKRLILVELAGANDGLNTLVPFTNDYYHRLRPEIGLTESEIIRVDDEMAMHKELQPLMALWQRGEFAWVQGLGYPKPNRSHFKSIEHWETGGDGTRDGREGWMTHDIEHRLGRRIVDAHGISLAGDIGLFASDTGRWMSLQTTEQMENTQTPLPSADVSYNASVELVATRMRELHETMNSLSVKLQSTASVQPLPGGQIGQQLARVLRLIRAGVDTPVFRVQHTGFDTHENQLARHARLLKRFALATSAMAKALKADGEWDNTLVMTYSEFGRRAAENDSGGTDHGTAAPHMIFGGAVNGGLFGSAPDLSALHDGDPAFTTDYRALYDQVLASWFGMQENRFEAYRDVALDKLVNTGVG